MIKDIDYKEVFTAWLISIKPTEMQKKLAQERLEVYKSCDKRK